MKVHEVRAIACSSTSVPWNIVTVLNLTQMYKTHSYAERSYFFASDYERDLELFLWNEWVWPVFSCCDDQWHLPSALWGTRKTRITAPQGTAKYLSRLKATDEQCIIRLVITVPFSSKVSEALFLPLEV